MACSRQPCKKTDIFPLSVMAAEKGKVSKIKLAGGLGLGGEEDEGEDFRTDVFGAKIGAVAEKIFEIKEKDPKTKNKGPQIDATRRTGTNTAGRGTPGGDASCVFVSVRVASI